MLFMVIEHFRPGRAPVRTSAEAAAAIAAR